MPTRLKRLYGLGHLHFITFSCYQREPLLDEQQARDFFVDSLAKMRVRHQFKLVGYVVMPEHVHLLVSEPFGNPSTMIMALKYRVARHFGNRVLALAIPNEACGRKQCPAPVRFWQSRFYDFNVYSSAKKEKLQYMHDNPVTRGLVNFPGEWFWSSFSFYATGNTGAISIDVVD